MIIQALLATVVSTLKLTGKRTDIISQVDFNKRPQYLQCLYYRTTKLTTKEFWEWKRCVIDRGQKMSKHFVVDGKKRFSFCTCRRLLCKKNTSLPKRHPKPSAEFLLILWLPLQPSLYTLYTWITSFSNSCFQNIC